MAASVPELYVAGFYGFPVYGVRDGIFTAREHGMAPTDTKESCQETFEYSMLLDGLNSV